jgi:hypothetical protein
VQEEFSHRYRQLLKDLGVDSYAEIQQRCANVEKQLPLIRETAGIIMSSNPEIENEYGQDPR